MLKCCMSFPFCVSEPLVCRVGGTSRTALLIHQCALQLEQWVHTHQVWGTEISTKLLTHLCLLRPWSSTLLGQDFKSRKQESLQADQLGHCALLVLLCVPSALTPPGLQSWNPGVQITFPLLLQGSQLWKKLLSHSSDFKCASGLWISWRSLHLLKGIYVMNCTLRQSKKFMRQYKHSIYTHFSEYDCSLKYLDIFLIFHFKMWLLIKELKPPRCNVWHFLANISKL